MEYSKIPLRNFYNPYRYVTVAPGETKLLWEFYPYQMDAVLFIELLANSYYDGLTYYWEIDGEVHKVDYQISPINQPLILPKPYVVRSYMKVYVKNSGSSSRVAEWLADGYLIERRELRRLL